jgi:hypothetical protein
MCDGSLHDSLTTHGANDPRGEGCISKGRIIVQRGSLMEGESNKHTTINPVSAKTKTRGIGHGARTFGERQMFVKCH